MVLIVMRMKHSMQRRRALWRAVDVAVVSTLMLTMVPVHAADASGTDLTSAEVAAEIIRVQADADEAARRWADAELSAEALALEIESAGAAIAATTLEYAQLEGELSQIAIDRFTGRSNETILVLGGNAVEAMQRDALRAMALDAGAANADTVAAVQKGLTDQQRHLERLNAENARLVAVLAESQASLNAQLKDLAQLETRLKDEEVKREYEAQLAAQRQEAERVAAAEAAAALAQQQAAIAQIAPVRGGGAGASEASSSQAAASAAAAAAPAQIVGNDAWLCPVAGLNAFGDTWGAPRPGGRKHQGVDMMSPSGTPVVAVVAGVVKLSTSERGGNLASLTGDDGNRYFYGHLSAWEGPGRRVAAGEVIGYVGKTGQTDANHLHFEIHPNGGAAVNPYPTVRNAC